MKYSLKKKLREKLGTRLCLGCNVEFRPTRGNQIYHSKKCKDTHFWKTHKVTRIYERQLTKP